MRNQLRWDILKLFSCKNLYAFEIRDVLNEFPEENPGSLAKILTEMVKQGMLSKITRNIYHIISLMLQQCLFMAWDHYPVTKKVNIKNS